MDFLRGHPALTTPAPPEETTPSLRDTPPKETTPSLRDTPPKETTPSLRDTPPKEGNDRTFNSPPLEGWQAQPDGVVSKSRVRGEL